MSPPTARRGLGLRGQLDGERLLLPLAQGRQCLGSDPSCDLWLPAAGVSKRHARLCVEGERVLLEDLASKNGTFVRGRRIDSATVGPGSRVAFGVVTMVIEEIDAEETLLAVDLGRHHPTLGEHGDTETPDWRPTSDGGVGGVSIAISFLERLESAAADGPFAAALEILRRDLALDGVCLLAAADAAAPQVVAVSGDLTAVDPAAVAAALGRPRAESGEEILLPPQNHGVGARPGLVLADASRQWALMAWGGGATSRESRDLLRLALVVVRRLYTAPDNQASAPRRLAELAWPRGYVRSSSPVMEELYRQLQAVVRSTLPVLVLGETGSGKEAIAEILHASSDRRDGPLVTLDCAAIPADLLEAELFGIGSGVATGVSGRPGRFQEANGGTIFLDEIGDMPLVLQSKLLRVLQEGEVRPLGKRPETIDVRVVAATNNDLERRMESGRFRRDLFYRLAGLVLHVPPLRHRREDIPALVAHFLRREATTAGRPVRGMTIGAMKRLVARPWPGNVRELEHEVRRLVYQAADHRPIDSAMLAVSDQPTSLEPRLDLARLESLDLREIEAQVIAEALRRSGGAVTAAARRLGLTRQALRRRMARLGLA